MYFLFPGIICFADFILLSFPINGFLEFNNNQTMHGSVQHELCSKFNYKMIGNVSLNKD